MSIASSPCIGLCTLEPATTLCFGCGRNLQEIAAWGNLSETERCRIIALLPARLAASENRVLDVATAAL